MNHVTNKFTLIDKIKNRLDKQEEETIKINTRIDIIEERRGQFFKVIIQPFAHPNTYSFVSVIKERS